MSDQPDRSIVTLEAVDVDIDGCPVLREISLRLGPGEHWGIVGGNGSGKSTLLALIAGKRWPVPGHGTRTYDFGAGPERDAVTARERISLFGHELQDLYPARNWNFKVRDVVLSGLTRSDIPQRRRSAADIGEANALLRRMRLDHLADRRILTLSRGEQRRVLIARALACKPSLLLLDEPASGLDAESRQELDSMLATAGALTRLAIATHSPEQLPAVVNRIAAMRAGRISLSETIAERDPGTALGSATIAAPAIGSNPADDKPGIVLALKHASVWIDGQAVLRDLDWTLRPGEHWLVTGANGAGKSSLLRLLHGELRPALGGTIRRPGLGEPGDVWTLRQRIALVSAELQARYRYPTRVFDAVASGFTASIGRTRPLSSDECRRVDMLLADFELEGLSDRLLSTLSYGQRHRVLIARTLAAEPRILLLDEPWEGLDEQSAGIVRRELIRCTRSGTQLICVSHVGAGGLPLNRELKLDQGRIVNAGDSDAPAESSASERHRAANCRPD